MTTTDTQARHLGDYPSEQLNDLLLMVISRARGTDKRLNVSMTVWERRIFEAYKEAKERETKLPFE